MVHVVMLTHWKSGAIVFTQPNTDHLPVWVLTPYMGQLKYTSVSMRQSHNAVRTSCLAHCCAAASQRDRCGRTQCSGQARGARNRYAVDDAAVLVRGGSSGVDGTPVRVSGRKTRPAAANTLGAQRRAAAVLHYALGRFRCAEWLTLVSCGCSRTDGPVCVLGFMLGWQSASAAALVTAQ